MNLDDFVDKYLDKKIDYDGFFGGQCVDLYRQYVEEVLGFPQSPGVGGAAEIWDSADTAYYDFIPNTPTGVPEKGDIVVWNRKAGGGFGHVSVFLKGHVNEFTSFDQNWPTLSKCTLTKHNYTNVIGWLRPKKGGGSMTDDGCLLANDKKGKETFERLVTKSTKYDEFDRKGWDNAGKVEQLLQEMRESITAEKDSRKDAEETAGEWRSDYQGLLEFLASDEALQTRIDPVEIRNKAKTFGKVSGDLEDLKDRTARETEAWNEKESDLNAEIARLKAILKREDVLKDSELVDLIKEIIQRLIHISRKR